MFLFFRFFLSLHFRMNNDKSSKYIRTILSTSITHLKIQINDKIHLFLASEFV